MKRRARHADLRVRRVQRFFGRADVGPALEQRGRQPRGRGRRHRQREQVARGELEVEAPGQHREQPLGERARALAHLALQPVLVRLLGGAVAQDDDEAGRVVRLVAQRHDDPDRPQAVAVAA